MLGPTILGLVAGASAAAVAGHEDLALARRSVVAPRSVPSYVGCNKLKLAHPTKVFFPDEDVYEWENQAFWSNTEIMTPACIFRPSSAKDVSSAIKISQSTQSSFAVRGGGHMAFPGANSIDDGILLVSSNLTVLDVSDDRKSVEVGPGFRWGDVYTYLEQFDLAVAGGRLAPVGVPGLLLGGGISFLGNQHGWAADNVLEYEVVLASGKIVTASATSNHDLFWALKGGSSNFGIVTKFTLRTFVSKKVWAGAYSVGPDHLEEFLAAVANYSAFNTDPLSHLVPMVVPLEATSAIGSAVIFYDSETVSAPACFEAFLSIPSTSSTLGFKTMAEFADEMGGLVVDKINDLFVAGTTVGKDYDTLYAGVKITNDVFLSKLPELYAAVPASDISLISINWQPIGDLWQDGSKAANPGGNPLGIDVESKGTYLAWAEVVEWRSEKYNGAVNAWLKSTTEAINNATKAAGIFDAYNYMGDAAGWQEVYAGYGDENVEKLKSVSRAYDPKRVFQTLLPGGFKIGA